MTSNVETRCTPSSTVSPTLTTPPFGPSFWYVIFQTAVEYSLANSLQHLNKVQEHYTQNRMNAGNLAICFGYAPPLKQHLNPTQLTHPRPTLMGANSGGNIADAGWQVRVIETILNNTFQIFDDD